MESAQSQPACRCPRLFFDTIAVSLIDGIEQGAWGIEEKQETPYSMRYALCGERSEPLITSLAHRLPQGRLAAQPNTTISVDFQNLDENLITFIEHVPHSLHSLMI